MITTFCHYQLFFPFSCWLIHFCMDAYRQSTLGWLGFADWWFITRNSIKLKVSVINNWSIFLWTTLRSNLTKLPASIERMVSSFVLCPIQRLEVYYYGISDHTLCLFNWFWITKTETDDIHTHIGLLMAILSYSTSTNMLGIYSIVKWCCESDFGHLMIERTLHKI